jgi:hypothetical protein
MAQGYRSAAYNLVLSLLPIDLVFLSFFTARSIKGAALVAQMSLDRPAAHTRY